MTLALHGRSGKLVWQDCHESPTKPGDDYLRPYTVSKAVEPSFFRGVFPRKGAHVVADALYSVVISCPVCAMPIMTSSAQGVASTSPLTIENPIACLYAAPGGETAHSFSIRAGKIQIVNG